MQKEAEGGALGTAQTKSYTYGLTQIVLLICGWFAARDLFWDGPRHLALISGIGSSLWIAVWLFFGNWIVGGLCASTASVMFTQHTGTVYTQDRLGFAKAGGTDIAFWSGLLSLLLVLFSFHAFVPAGSLGWFRPFALLLVAACLGGLLTRIVTRLVFSALYGPPQPGRVLGRLGS